MMKVIWEPVDIVVGRQYSKKDIKENWIIGYLPWIDNDEKFVSISLNDGMVTKPKTRENFAIFLNVEQYLPCELITNEN
jgi:hypothetical protein